MRAQIIKYRFKPLLYIGIYMLVVYLLQSSNYHNKNKKKHYGIY